MDRAAAVLILLVTGLTCAEALEETTICYILDGILLLYGIILTILYCRLKMHLVKQCPDVATEKLLFDDGNYMGLSPYSYNNYETIEAMPRKQHA